MHETAALLLATLLTSPAALALAPPAPPALPALPAPEALPLALAVPPGPPEVVVGVAATIPVAVSTAGLAGTGVQPPLERRVHLGASLDSGDAATFEPNPLVLAPGAAGGAALLRFTPTRLGPLGLSLEAAWETLPGHANLSFTRSVIKDSLAVESLAAGAPDADLDLTLNATLRSGHLQGELFDWRVEATHTPVNGTEPLAWTAAAGQGRASPSGQPWSAEVRARYGPGRYDFTLVAGGARLDDAVASLAVDVPEVRLDQGSVNFTLDVEDHPTTLRLASDSVNADGKAKTPGNALITRVVVGDANGLGDVRSVTFAYARNDSGTLVPVWTRTLAGLGPGLDATLEDRFDLSPMKDAGYVCTVTADGTGVVRVQRTFAISDVLPDAALALEAAEFLPARAGALNATLVVRDANFGTGPLDASDLAELGALQLRLFKGSTAVAEPGWALAAGGEEGPAPLGLDLGAEGTRTGRFAYRVAAGKGELAVPVEVRIPEGATPGAYRLSVAEASTLASAPFNVTALPRVTRLAPLGPAPPGGTLAVEVEVGPATHATGLELRAPWGATVRAAPGEVVVEGTAWRWNASLPVPSPWDDDVVANLTAVADLGDGRVVVGPSGQPVNARTIALPVANAPPRLEAALRLAGVRVGDEAWLHPHAALELTAEVRAGDDNAVAPDLRDELGPLEGEVRDWTGALARFEVDGEFTPAGSVLQVQPLGVEPGRYALHLRARDDDGAVAEQVLGVNIGVHFRLGLQAEQVAFAADEAGMLRATVPMRNLGNAAARSIAVLAEGLPDGAAVGATLELANGTLLRAPLAGGFARFEAARLVEPSEWARLHLDVDARQGVRAGHFEGRIVVAGEAA